MTAEPEERTPQYLSLCSECQTGVLHLEFLTYYTWLSDELITVPNFPAWVCDVCGRRVYDERAVSRLNTMLSHGARRRPNRRGPRPGISRADHPHT